MKEQNFPFSLLLLLLLSGATYPEAGSASVGESKDWMVKSWRSTLGRVASLSDMIAMRVMWLDTVEVRRGPEM